MLAEWDLLRMFKAMKVIGFCNRHCEALIAWSTEADVEGIVIQEMERACSAQSLGAI